MSIPLIIFGASGKMGQAILQEASKTNDFSIVAAIVKPSSPIINQKVLNLDLAYTSTTNIKKAVIIDVSLAHGLPQSVELAKKLDAALVVCSSGHNEENYQLLKEASREIPVLIAANTSIMLNIMADSVKKMAKLMPTSDTEIIELHHRNKKDAPSATALFLAQTMQKKVNISSLRAGSAYSEHSVLFFNDFEHLEIKHCIHNRSVLAQGALFASKFIFGQAPGLYSMSDVINL